MADDIERMRQRVETRGVPRAVFVQAAITR
jgi:hypothetical protein